MSVFSTLANICPSIAKEANFEALRALQSDILDKDLSERECLVCLGKIEANCNTVKAEEYVKKYGEWLGNNPISLSYLIDKVIEENEHHE